MLKLNPGRCELLSDGILGLLVVLPPIMAIVFLFDCGAMDGRSSASCAHPAFEPFAVALQAFFLIMAWGGLVLYLPIVAAAYFNSTRYKYRALKAGTLRKLSFTFIIWLITTCFVSLVVAVIAFELYVLVGELVRGDAAG